MAETTMAERTRTGNAVYEQTVVVRTPTFLALLDVAEAARTYLNASGIVDRGPLIDAFARLEKL